MNNNNLLKIWIVPVALMLVSIISLPARAGELISQSTTQSSLDNLVYIPLVGGPASSGNGIYFLSPNGDDGNSGRSESEAWKTFEHAWQFLYPGDTLILLDGTYYQSLAPSFRNGEPGNPITIKAKNDGKVIIDGQHQRIPVSLKHEANGWGVGNWFIIEGIIAQNSSDSVYKIIGDHNILRRVSGYNANTDTNAHVFDIASSEGNLIEDCIARGSGRKMILVFNSENVTIRRCFADWQEWDGRQRHHCWPWGDGIEIYNADYNIIENSISYSRNPTQSINVNGQGGAIGNKIYGSMAIMAGMNEDGTPMDWGDTRPQPTEYTCVRDFNWPGMRAGFGAYESGAAQIDNLWQDIFAWGSAGLGISWITGVADPGTGNNRIIRATVFNNGLDNPEIYGGIHTDALQSDLDKFDSVENSFIENIITSSGKITMNGEGARLTHRYIDGLLTNEPLWPWPMEDRIQAELGFSVTDFMINIIFGTSDLSEIYP